MAVDIWSRKVVGWQVHTEECGQNASMLFTAACRREGVLPDFLVLHADNGSSMKSATLSATLQNLGVPQSFSRPSVSNDNPYSESLFRTLKYRPAYPSRPFQTAEDARRWVADFVRWYNTEHLHSGIRFVTPADRHDGRDGEILAKRAAVYAAARRRHPDRWSGPTRNWTPITEVRLNPDTIVYQQSA